MHPSITFAGDYAVLALLVLYKPVADWLFWPRFARSIRDGVMGARKNAYIYTFIELWVFTLCVLTVWVMQRRPWHELWLGGATALRFSLGCLLALIVIAFFVLQGQKVQKALARPKAVARLREKLAFADSISPQTASDRHWFWLLSITAGICEEIIFRGFLMWLISVWTGVIFAAIISSVIFGLEHVYLGVAQVPRIALLGLGFVIVVLISGSLLPAMVIHATMDLSSGEISFRVAQASLATTTAPPLTS